MRIYTEDGIRVIEADTGAYVTNGETYSEKVYLGKNADSAEWRDATAEEKAEWDERQHEEPETIKDKAEAYDILMGEEESE